MKGFELGSLLKDKVTGFMGVAMGKATYLTGCDQYCLQPRCKETNAYPTSQWFDEGRLQFVSNSFSSEDVKAEENGSDYTAPKK